MNRRALLGYLQAHDWFMKREEGSHLIWINSNEAMQAVPRHDEIADCLARSICRKPGLPDHGRPDGSQKAR